MRFISIVSMALAAILPVFALPTPSMTLPSLRAALDKTDDKTVNEVTSVDQRTEKRDGSSEFDTDLCLLKKRGSITGVGVNNCDI